MSELRFTLTADGPSDRVLVRHLAWMLRQHLSREITVQLEWADLRPLREKPQGLAGRIQAALDLYPCDLLFVHRDAEREDPSVREDEIRRAMDGLGVQVPFICVVPVRMTEAWLLFDEQAIRRAAGNPSAQIPLAVPHADAERIPNPKSVLHGLLRSASGLAGRRLEKFATAQAVHHVAEYIDDFSPLRALPAFKKLETDLAAVIQGHGWS